jgi:serine protease Do
MPGRHENSPAIGPEREQWRVRIRDATSRATLGAGVLLAGEDHVLTCAHVLGDLGDDVLVESVSFPHPTPTPAHVVPGCYVPPLGDQRGDVALLQLGQRLTQVAGTTLRRAALSWHRPVRVCGFPRELDDGVYTRARLAGYVGPSGEWLQMNAQSWGEQRVRAGFSGAGVVDEHTGEVLGIVVGYYADITDWLSWMIPVETIVDHIRPVARWVTGDPALDEEFGTRAGNTIDRPGLARAIATWLHRRDTGDAIMIIVGSGVSELYRAVALSSRERRTVAIDPLPVTVPALGSVDLALDVSGKSVDEVSRRIIGRAGIPRDEAVSPSEQVRSGIPPMTIVLDGIDRAQEPGALLNEVLRPMAESDHRLLLAFGEESSPGLAIARSWDIGTIPHRLDRLDERIRALGEAEQRLMALSLRVKPPEPVTSHFADLRIALSQLRKMAAADPESTWEPLERCERRTARSARRAAELTDQLEELLTERNELRGLLGAYRAKANHDGLVEDIALAADYRRARALLWQSPVDVPGAREAVQKYWMSLHRARGGRPGKE